MQAQKRRATRRQIHYILKTKILVDSFRDIKCAETVSRTSQHDLFLYGYSCFPDQKPEVIVGCAPEVEMGLVLSDSKGGGAFQR